MSKELQLILLALIVGAIGSYVHAVKSLSDFIGNRTLMASWFWWYVTRPFLGSAMALIFYALLRGGFLAGTPADAKAVSPFGVIGCAPWWACSRTKARRSWERSSTPENWAAGGHREPIGSSCAAHSGARAARSQHR